MIGQVDHNALARIRLFVRRGCVCQAHLEVDMIVSAIDIAIGIHVANDARWVCQGKVQVAAFSAGLWLSAVT